MIGFLLILTDIQSFDHLNKQNFLNPSSHAPTKKTLKHLLTLPILTMCSSSGLQPDQMVCLWRGSWPENRPEALWEQTHFYCVRRILKCGKPCAAAAPSSREAGEGVWPGHVRPCAGSRGSSEEGNCETWSATTHTHGRRTHTQQTDTRADGRWTQGPGGQ